VAVLLHVPQQPIFDGKVEDQIIALTFEKYLQTRDNEWPLLLPMVKSAVRAMDTAQDFSEKHWGGRIESFTVSGASKRGWTTWLTGAVDKRATTLAPMVIDMLNMAPQLKHQRESFGAVSEEINDYTERGLLEHLESDAGAALRAIVDPYSYRRSLTQPKLILLGTNDNYWPLDALNLYWDGLSGEKHILYVPNNGHGLQDLGRITGALAAMHRRGAEGLPLPKLAWRFDEQKDGVSLTVSSDVKPSSVNIWTAESATRDFRQSRWKSLPATAAAGEEFGYSLSAPSNGCAAFFGEAVFEGESLPLFLSTNVRIISAKP
jgi:PhoPQ-activated pathogenicity-related protein